MATKNKVNGESKRERIDNNLLNLAAGVKFAAELGGFGSDLSNYGSIAYSNNYSLITLNRAVLTYLYTGNGIFQTAVQLPVQDALSRRIVIESDEMSNSDIEEVMDFWEYNGVWEILESAADWSRLYGGGGLVVNTPQDPKKPLDFKKLLNNPLEFYDVDRWQLDAAASKGMDPFVGDHWYGNQEYYYVHGEAIHKSRIIIINGKKAPSYVRRYLRGWGLSEAERMIRDLNNFLKTQNVLYEILDESKVDVYHIKNLANKLLTTGGTNKMINRVQAANEVKNYVNALVLDAEEEFDQKQVSFGGIAEIMNENRLGVSSATRIPTTKLFGLSASGFNTGESDIENYNEMVESEVRARVRPAIKQLLQITMYHLFGHCPHFRFHFPSLRQMTALDEQHVLNAKHERALTLYDRGLLTSEEMGQFMSKESIMPIETKAEQGLLPDFPMSPQAGPMKDGTKPAKDLDTVGEVPEMTDIRVRRDPREKRVAEAN